MHWDSIFTLFVYMSALAWRAIPQGSQTTGNSQIQNITSLKCLVTVGNDLYTFSAYMYDEFSCLEYFYYSSDLRFKKLLLLNKIYIRPAILIQKFLVNYSYFIPAIHMHLRCSSRLGSLYNVRYWLIVCVDLVNIFNFLTLHERSVWVIL